MKAPELYVRWWHRGRRSRWHVWAERMHATACGLVYGHTTTRSYLPSPTPPVNLCGRCRPLIEEDE